METWRCTQTSFPSHWYVAQT